MCLKVRPSLLRTLFLIRLMLLRGCGCLRGGVGNRSTDTDSLLRPHTTWAASSRRGLHCIFWKTAFFFGREEGGNMALVRLDPTAAKTRSSSSWTRVARRLGASPLPSLAVCRRWSVASDTGAQQRRCARRRMWHSPWAADHVLIYIFMRSKKTGRCSAACLVDGTVEASLHARSSAVMSSDNGGPVLHRREYPVSHPTNCALPTRDLLR